VTGVRLTMRHYYDFGDDRTAVGEELASPRAWDALRTETSGAFAMSRTRHEFWEAAELRPELAARARAIDAWLDEHSAATVASYGVGAAQLELLLNILSPHRSLVVTDYAELTVARLSDVFPEARVVHHDLRRDGPIDADAHIFHRIDTELSNREWPDVFRRFGSTSILVVATALLTARRTALEIGRRPLLKLRHASSAGYIRTGATFEAFWSETHVSRRLRVHDLHAWSLDPLEPTET
jgi:hypothetical protein